MASLWIKALVSKGLKEIWDTGVLSDVTLLADGTEFRAHKVVLAAASPFFMAMFTGGWAETDSNKGVELKGISATSLKRLLEYIYTAEISPSPEEVMGMLSAADQLQIRPAIHVCASYMEDLVDADNCVDVLNISQMHNLDSLKKVACDFTCKNFQQVLQSKQHCRLELSDFLYFLDGYTEGEDVVELDSEMTVFSAVLEWLKYDQEKRMAYVTQVMEVVRFNLLSPKELDEIISNVPFMTSNSECEKMIRNAQAYHQKPVHQRIVVNSKTNRVRSRESILITSQLQSQNLEAWNLNPHPTTLENPEETNWVSLPSFPKFEFEVPDDLKKLYQIEINGFVIVLFVKPPGAEQVQSKLAAYVFDPRSFSWSELQSYELSPGSHIETATICQNNLYVFLEENEDQATEILKYNFEDNTWQHHDYMRPRFVSYTVCTSQDQIYVFGLPEVHSCIYTHVYNPTDLSWTMKHFGSDQRDLKNWRAFVDGRHILHTSDEHNILTYDMYHSGEDRWSTPLWLYKFSDLSSSNDLVIAGRNLFFLHHTDDKPYLTELTLGQKFRNIGKTLVKHQPMPFSLSESSLMVAVRIPLCRLSSME